MKKITTVLFIGVFLSALNPVLAEEQAPTSPSGMWVVKGKDGSMEFSNKWKPGAKPYSPKKELNILPSNAPSTMSQSAQTRQYENTTPTQNKPSRAELQKKVDDAKSAIISGEEPLPGERTSNVSGGSRLNEQYYERQQLLKQQLEDAERNLNSN